MASFAFRTWLSERFSLLRNDQQGAAAIEFAAVGLLMVTLWIGCVEITGGVAAQRKVTLATRTVADLATRFERLNNADVQTVLRSAAAVLYPSSDSNLEVTVSAVNIDADGIAKVAWSDQLKTGQTKCPARSVGAAVPLPAEVLKVPDSQLIWGEVCYLYRPGLGGLVITELPFRDQIFMRPRRSDAVNRVQS